MPTVNASLTYSLHLPEKLIYKITEMGEDEDSPEYHAWYEAHQMDIKNARSIRSRLSLDQEGFELKSFKTAVQNFYDDKEVERIYNPEIERLIMDATGADRALIFDHTIRAESDELREKNKHVRSLILSIMIILFHQGRNAFAIF